MKKLPPNSSGEKLDRRCRRGSDTRIKFQSLDSLASIPPNRLSFLLHVFLDSILPNPKIPPLIKGS